MIKPAFSSTMAKDNNIANLIAVCPDGIIGVDLHGTVVFFNAKAAALTQRNLEDVIGSLDIGQIYGSREQARQIKTALYAEDYGGVGRLDGFETAIVDIKNKTIPIRLSAALIIENGNEVGSVGFFHDLTNQKIMEEKLHKLSITELGNSIHKTDISAAFHLDGLDGCRYYSSYLDQVQSNWVQFAEKMNSVLKDPACHDAVIAAAHEAFTGLNDLYSALFPLPKNEKTFHVTRINPEAGNHPIPNDEREIQAALNASDRIWAEFPYYELRYGQRGKRFSDSDTCWLVTLTSLDPESMQKQIDWIGRVLATRGMPLLMLENTLRILYEELSMMLPDNTATYQKLLWSADILSKARGKSISNTLFQSLSSEFEQLVGSEMTEKYKKTGKLLVSSVADEKGGIKGAVCALQDWMVDTSRFPEQWITAVNSIIIKARQVSV
ncbi:MAG: PAS domain-containing protein [Pseudomonadota bacterium]